MTSLTDNQNRAMTALIKSCLGNMGGSTLANLQGDPFTWVDVEDLVEAGWGQKEAEGTLESDKIREAIEKEFMPDVEVTIKCDNDYDSCDSDEYSDGYELSDSEPW